MKRIDSSLPTDLDTACKVLNDPPGDKGYPRYLLFRAGATARALNFLGSDTETMFPAISNLVMFSSARASTNG